MTNDPIEAFRAFFGAAKPTLGQTGKQSLSQLFLPFAGLDYYGNYFQHHLKIMCLYFLDLIVAQTQKLTL